MSLNVALCSIRPVLSSGTTVRRRHLIGIAMAYDSNSELRTTTREQFLERDHCCLCMFETIPRGESDILVDLTFGRMYTPSLTQL